jgi:hypothetical protein
VPGVLLLPQVRLRDFLKFLFIYAARSFGFLAAEGGPCEAKKNQNMGCIASCHCFTRSSQVQLTEQHIQLQTPVDESQEDADRFKRVRQWVLSIEEIPREMQLAAMEEYISMNFTDYDNDGDIKSQFQLRKSITGTQESLESGDVSPESGSPRRIALGSGRYEMLCKGPSFEESNFKNYRETEESAVPSSMKVENGGIEISSGPVEIVNSFSILPEVKKHEGSEGEISIGKSEGHSSTPEEMRIGGPELKKQLTLPGRTARSNSPETLKWFHS